MLYLKTKVSISLIDMVLSSLFQVIDNYVGGRGLISEKETNGSTVSNIYVGAATIQDTGNYTCEAPALASNASVNLHVLVDGNISSLFF